MFVSGILLRRPFSTRLTSQVVNNPPLQYEDTQFLFTYKFELKFTFIHIHMPEGLGFFCFVSFPFSQKYPAWTTATEKTLD